MHSKRISSGFFRPRNPAKYKGKLKTIEYRSSWEARIMMWCDATSGVLEWSSEEVVIPYKSPVDLRYHRYFVDFWAKIMTNSGPKEFLFEIKPKKETMLPKLPKSGKHTASYIKAIKTYAINDAKWKAARAYCEKNDMSFLILTEDIKGLAGMGDGY